MAVAVAVAHRPGAEEIVRRRRRPPSRCATPGCGEAPVGGGRFCGPHQKRLDRIRGELEAERRAGENGRRWRERTTRGMNGLSKKERSSDS